MNGLVTMNEVLHDPLLISLFQHGTIDRKMLHYCQLSPNIYLIFVKEFIHLYFFCCCCCYFPIKYIYSLSSTTYMCFRSNKVNLKNK